MSKPRQLVIDPAVQFHTLDHDYEAIGFVGSLASSCRDAFARREDKVAALILLLKEIGVTLEDLHRIYNERGELIT